MNGRRSFPLFWRIFLLIWLAMAVTVVASTVVTRELVDRERLTIQRQEGLRDLAAEAIEIRSSEGRGAAWRYLKEQGEQLDLHLMLLDPQDHGTDELPSRIRERMAAGWHRQQPAVIELDGGFRLVAWPRVGAEGWLDPRTFRVLELGFAFFSITLACWWIARRLSRPLRKMETTARAIAGGDTNLRVGPAIAGRQDEMGALARAFNAMTDQLCELLERQNQLLRDISHDLRTPLTRQRIAIELASESELEPGLMASILRQNERLEAMTAQILTLYRVTGGPQSITRESVDMSRVIHDVLTDAADYAEHQGVDCQLTAQPHTRSVTVLGDEGLLRRALDNILQNALDHTPPGRIVQISLSEENGRLTCVVADQGPGVSEEALAHLFEPFFRVDQSRGGKGWGLGLAIARDIVSRHDGRIEARNGVEGGLVVSLELPVFTSGAT